MCHVASWMFPPEVEGTRYTHVPSLARDRAELGRLPCAGPVGQWTAMAAVREPLHRCTAATRQRRHLLIFLGFFFDFILTLTPQRPPGGGRSVPNTPLTTPPHPAPPHDPTAKTLAPKEPVPQTSQNPKISTSLNHKVPKPQNKESQNRLDNNTWSASTAATREKAAFVFFAMCLLVLAEFPTSVVFVLCSHIHVFGAPT